MSTNRPSGLRAPRPVPRPFTLTVEEKRELSRYLHAVHQTVRRAAADCGRDHAAAAVLAALDRSSAAWRPFRRRSVRRIVQAAVADAVKCGSLLYLSDIDTPEVRCEETCDMCTTCGRPQAA